VAFRYPIELSAGFHVFHVTRAIALPGRTTQVFPSAFRRPTAFLGFNRPFAGFIPQPGGRATFASHGASDQHTVVLVVIDISAGPGPRAVRASASAPIDFRRGDRSPVGVNKICKSDRPGMRMASTSGLWLPSAVRPVSARLAHETILPWALPLAGLSGTSLCIGWARPRYRSPASGPPANNWFATDDSYPLMGLLDVSFPSRATVVLRTSCRPARSSVIAKYWAFASSSLPYSVLMGLMPSSTCSGPRGLIRPTPCLRFCTVR